MNYPTELVFAAACAAQRINGEYIKAVKWPDRPTEGDTRQFNRGLMVKLLSPGKCTDTGDYITDDDTAHGIEVRKYYQTLTFKILKGKPLTEFESNVLALCNRDEIGSNYDLAIVASLPSGYARSVNRDTVENRVKFATGGFIGAIGDKVTLNVEILRTFFSQQWNVFFVTALTDDDKALFFSFKNKPDDGAKLRIKGTVKAHRVDDNQTQLNRVAIV
jgi:hypothetical protein